MTETREGGGDGSTGPVVPEAAPILVTRLLGDSPVERGEPVPGAASETSVRTLSRRLADYTQHIENLNIAEYVELVRNPRRMFFLNLISGIGRGFGIAIGFTVLGAIVLVFLRYLLMLNLPHIGGFIAELVRIVQNRLSGP